MNVSLVNGVPTGSSVTSLYSNTNLAINSASWCALSTTNLIAFVVNENTGGGSAVGKLYTVSADGGSPTLVYSDTLRFSGPQWSPDDQEIVIGVLHNGTSSTPSWGEMRIIDVANGTHSAVPVSHAFIADSYRWTRAGANKILYRYAETNNNTPVAMIYDVASGASTEVNGTQINGCWSPRNDKLLCRIGTSTDLKAFNPANGTSSTVTTSTNTVSADWKR